MMPYSLSGWLKADDRRSSAVLQQRGRGKHSARHRFMPRLDDLEERKVPSYVFQTIDPPLAALGSAATGINSSGQVVGEFTDSRSVTHGYLLSDGQYTTIDAPGAAGVTNAF